MMKILPFTIVLLCSISGSSQVLGIYNLVDHLVTADHPNCAMADDDYVLGMPNDSIWVNIAANDVMQGMFSSNWTDGDGNELVIESGFNADQMSVRLILSDNSLSAVHSVEFTDWELLGEVNWLFVFAGEFCTEGMATNNQSIIGLDFDSDFGLSPTDIVKGIEITFLAPDTDVDLAGVYISDVAQEPQVGLSETEIGEVSFFPNPIGDSFAAQIENVASSYEVIIYDLLGNVMFSEIASSSNIQIDSSQWSSGLYLARVGGQVHKIVKD